MRGNDGTSRNRQLERTGAEVAAVSARLGPPAAQPLGRQSVTKLRALVGLAAVGAGVAIIGLALYALFAGVRLELENQSGQQIRDIRVQYDRGSFSVASLDHNQVVKKPLGKIGEGASFDVGWKEVSGLQLNARLSVYFYGLTGYDTVRIRFLPEGKSELLYDDRTYYPDEHLTNRSSPRAGGRGRLSSNVRVRHERRRGPVDERST